MGNFIDITGQRFSRLVVLERGPNEHEHTLWKCRCDCGALCYRRGDRLRAGTVKSCGCLYRETRNDQRMPRTTIQAAKELYMSGYSLEEVCRALHYSPRSSFHIAKVLRREGVRMRRSTRRMKVPTRVIMEAYRTHGSFAAAGRALTMPAETVRARIRSYQSQQEAQS